MSSRVDHGLSTCLDNVLLPCRRLLGPPLTSGGGALSGITVTSARMYNYAIPQASLLSEAVCAGSGTCGTYFLSGEPD